MKTIFSQFADLLDVRFRNEIYTTEDAVRYTMFASMLYQDIPSDSLSFEHPHPTLKRAKIDTWLQIDGEKPIAIEFKYDRGIPSGRNLPGPQKPAVYFMTCTACFLSIRVMGQLVILFMSPRLKWLLISLIPVMAITHSLSYCQALLSKFKATIFRENRQLSENSLETNLRQE